MDGVLTTTGQESGNIDRLIMDFIKVHKADYLELKPYIQYLRAAFALGVEEGIKMQVKKTDKIELKMFK